MFVRCEMDAGPNFGSSFIRNSRSLARSLGDATPPAALRPACRQPGKQSISGSARVTAKVTQKMPIPSALEL